ncbi:MAG: hypothetical protein WCV69_03565 [Patescibacteria group bacterium]|jgi:hypothetical protein
MAYTIVAAIGIVFFNLNYYMAVALVLVPPTLVNFFWLSIARAKVFLFSLIVTALITPLIALASRFVSSGDWRIPAAPLAMTNLLFTFFTVLWVISFYKYFVKHEQVGDISDRFHYLFSLYIFLLITVLALCFAYPYFFKFSSYLIFVPFFILPAAIIISWQKDLLKQSLSTAAFFSLVFIIMQAVLVVYNNWLWPSTSFLSIYISGVNFSIFDLIFRFAVFVSIIVVHEYFMNLHANLGGVAQPD